MTDIAAMPAGPELDRVVAEKVMGWPITEGGEWVGFGANVGNHRPTCHASNWRPSSDIAHAWDVVERMRGMGYGYNLSASPGGMRHCEFERDGLENEEGEEGVAYFDDSAAHQALAICRAALAAMGAG